MTEDDFKKLVDYLVGQGMAAYGNTTRYSSATFNTIGSEFYVAASGFLKSEEVSSNGISLYKYVVDDQSANRLGEAISLSTRKTLDELTYDEALSLSIENYNLLLRTSKEIEARVLIEKIKKI